MIRLARPVPEQWCPLTPRQQAGNCSLPAVRTMPRSSFSRPDLGFRGAEPRTNLGLEYILLSVASAEEEFAALRINQG